jgi:cytochrome b subunit of formate dehydrogenase
MELLEKGEKIRRFSTARIIEHYIAILSVSLLIATGLSQKYYYLDISQWFILQMGGIDSVRFVHRFTGLIFIALTVVHILTAMIGVLFLEWRPSILITKKDFHDAVHNIKYYLGMEDCPAPCHRYTYKQKFEYWVILTGAIFMIFSGVVLWIPTTITRYLPGEIIPLAKVMHSNEALLLFLIISIWHVYNSIFSPDVFPLDTAIFTGYISLKRMEKEHPLELAEMLEEDIKEIQKGVCRNRAKQEVDSVTEL